MSKLTRHQKRRRHKKYSSEGDIPKNLPEDTTERTEAVKADTKKALEKMKIVETILLIIILASLLIFVLDAVGILNTGISWKKN